ncbi:hypothetical protein [Vibrio parahaemolyticus]|uniref:hypothetical protein n=1 Tax=Vibrio parahaemolyticus TaxID=670 RepID=UPI0006C36EDC|nr:hypothetical protein ACX10_26255 [Vibrio parahaemolyticus]
MLSITIGTCPNCNHPTHKEVGSIGRNSTDACPNCQLLYTEDCQTNSALLGRVYEWQQIKKFHEAATFSELAEKLRALAVEHYQEDKPAWSYEENEDFKGLCKLGGMEHSVKYGLSHLKFIEDRNIQWRARQNNPDLLPQIAHTPLYGQSQGFDNPF